MTNKILTALIIGICLRLILSVSTFHPDIKHFALAGNIVSSGHILDLYDYLSTLPKDDSLVKTNPNYPFNYPPAIYQLFGIVGLFFRTLFSQIFLDHFLTNYRLELGNLQFNLLLLILKIPYLVFDLFVAFLLRGNSFLRLFQSQKEKNLIFYLWMFNPFNLYSTYMMGQFDIIPTFFVVLSLYLVNQKRMYLGSLSLGLGASFKLFPAFLIIPLVSLCKSWSERIKILLLAVIPYFAFILPYLPSEGFRVSALVANQTLKSLYAQIPVSAGESILLFPVVLIFYYLYLLLKNPEKITLWRMYFITLTFFFIFTHYHPQWLLWLSPFLIIDLVKTQLKNWVAVVLIFISFFISLFFFDPSLTIGLFSPLWTDLYQLPSVWEILRLNPDYNFFRSLLQTLFTGAALYLVYHTHTKKEDYS